MNDVDIGQAFVDYAGGRLSDPYPVFTLLRKEDPVHWSDRLETWLVTRYDDVLAGFSDPRLANNRIAGYMRALSPDNQQRYALLGSHVSNWLGFTDPPQHSHLRGHVREFFTPRLAERLRPTIERVADDLIADAARRRDMDAIADFAFPLPAAVIYDLLGIDVSRQAEFKELVDIIVQFPGNIGPILNEVAPSAHAAVVQMEAFFRDLLQQRAISPRDDLISRLAALLSEGEISEQEAVSLATFVFVAGHETSVSLIANGLMLLIRNPEQLALLRSEPKLIAPAVEEFLRVESPLQITTRQAGESLTIRDKRIRKGETVTLVNASANRDGDQFRDPDRVDITREPNRHLAFGWAAHFCLGAPLARIEGQYAISAFIERFPDARLEDDELEWLPNLSIRCPTHLPIDLGL